MDIITHYVDVLEREAARSRRVLEYVPDGQRGWKPHDRSMAFGPLADMVAMMPTWLTMIVTKDEHDIAPADGPTKLPQPETSAEYLKLLDHAVDQARAVIQGATDVHLETHWKLLVKGKVVADVTRHEMLSDTLHHWSHHRGQMTVYLRLMGEKVPALYGPSADENRFD